MANVPQAQVMTRRRLLNFLLGGSLAAWAASVVYPIVRYLTPLKLSGTGGPTTLTRQEAQKIDTQGFVIVPVGARRVIVFVDASQKLHALAAKCTHEGCTVQFRAREAVIWCACHNGRFDLAGRVISGPPPRPLTPFAVRRDLAGTITVFLEAA
jgi:cytochrome b6-f complex iron-sulfur subunit